MEIIYQAEKGYGVEKLQFGSYVVFLNFVFLTHINKIRN